jgi:hypothetical protein
MVHLSLRSWLTSMKRGRTAPIRRRSGQARLSVERFEDRTVPSTSIPLNNVNPTTQLPNTPDWTAIGPAPLNNGGFTSVTPMPVSGRVSGVAVDPTNPQRIFVAAASGGIWRTTDGGAHWTPLIDHLPSTTNTLPTNTPLTNAQRTLNIGAIAIAPSDPNTIYAAEGEGDGPQTTTGFGVLKSTDGGNTWVLTGTNVFKDTLSGTAISSHSIVVDSLNPNIAFVAVYTPTQVPPLPPAPPPNYGIGGIYRTLDGGTTWTNITKQASVFQQNQSAQLGLVTAFTDVDIVPRNVATDPVVVYACAGDAIGDSRNGIYRSINATNTTVSTVTWNLLIGGSAQLSGNAGNIQISISKTSPSTIYASIAKNLQGGGGLLGVYKTTDAGTNWQRLGTPPNYVLDYMNGAGSYTNVIAVSPTNVNIVIVGGTGLGPIGNSQGVLETTNGGATFADITTTNGTSGHTGDHAGVFDSLGNFLMGTNGGLFKLTTGITAHWVSLNGSSTSNPNVTALDTIQYVDVATDPTSADRALAGGPENGTARFNNNLGWTQTDGLDGERVLYDFDNPLHALHVTPLSSPGSPFLSFSDDGGQTWTPAFVSGIQDLGLNLSPAPLIIDAADSQRYFIGTDTISISEDGGVNWGQNYTFGPGSVIGITVAPEQQFGNPIEALTVGRAGTVDAFPKVYISNPAIPLIAPPIVWEDFLTPSGDTGWLDISPAGNPNVVKLVVDPQNSNNMYALTDTGHILVTHNVNTLTVFNNPPVPPVWTDITGNLPTGWNAYLSTGILNQSMVLDPKNFSNPNDDVLYVAGNRGQIFQLVNPGGTTFNWTRVGNPYNATTGKGMPDVDVTSLNLNTTTGILAAGTFGRGVFELQIRGLLRGEVFTDTNGNGVLDAGEAGLAGVTVRLINNDTNVEIANTVTDANGFYTFRSLTNSQLTATNYRIVEDTPTGRVQTTATLFFNNLSENSTFDIADPNLNKASVVIGTFVPGSITGVKYNDLNHDGVREVGEAGIGGVTIFNDSNNNGTFDSGELSTVTASDGTFTLANLGPAVINGLPNPATFNGTYIVREVQQTGWVQTTPQVPPILIHSGQAVNGISIGNVQIASISGQVYVDNNGDSIKETNESGLGNVTVTLSGPGGPYTTTTASDGTYSFTGLQAGTYTVTESVPSGYVQTTTNPAPITAGPYDHLSGFLFGVFKTITVSGRAFDDTNGNGSPDPSEPGQGGFAIDLVDPSTNVRVATTTTLGDGTFSFSGVGPLPGGTPYVIQEESQTGYVATTPTPPPFTPLSGGNISGYQFGTFKQYSVSGTAYVDLNGNGTQDSGEPGGGGFVMNLLDSTNAVVGTATTAADGSFTVSGVGPGTFTLVEAPRTGYQLSQGSAGYTVTSTSGTNVTGETFGNKQVASISGTVYVDMNGNGVRNTGEAAEAGVTVQLIQNGSVIGSTTTATDGTYTFNNLSAGTYSVGEVPPSGWVRSSVAPPPITVTSTDNPTGIDFGNFKTVTLSGTAFNDKNGNGTQDAGESGLAGVTIKLLNAATNALVASTTTGANGAFSFTGVGPVQGGGQYIVREVKPMSTVATTPLPPAFAPSSGTNITSFLFGTENIQRVTVTGEDQGGPPTVTVRDSQTFQLIKTFDAYTQTFVGGVRVAAGLIAGGAQPVIVTGPGPGGGPDVRLFNENTGALIFHFYAYDAKFTGGVYVAVGDVNGDGTPDVITGADAGGGPHVEVFDGAALLHGQVTILYSFFAYDASFHGGVRVASADINGDGNADIITGAGAGGGPNVRVFSGKTGGMIQSFYAYDPHFTAGIYVAAGDVNGDGQQDIVTGPGLGGGPHLRVFDGASNGATVLEEAYAFSPGQGSSAWSSGLRVATTDVNGDGAADIIVSPGAGQPPFVRLLDGHGLGMFTPPGQLTIGDPAFLGGIFVGGE